MNIIPTKYWWSSTEEFPAPLPNETKAESNGSIIGLNIREQRLKANLPSFDFSCSDSMTNDEKSLIRDRDYLVEQFVKAKNKGGIAFTKWKKENRYFYIPSILLPEDPSVKLAKGNKKGYVSYCMYLAPAMESGFANVCSDSSEQCEAGCLNSAGKGGFDVNVIYARYNKTLLFKYHKRWFYDKLYLEIQDIQRKHNSPTNREYKVPYCIRLNGTSDIPWENIKEFKGKKNIFDSFPSIQFYDYTKVLKRTTYQQPNNYDLTLSRSEGDANQRICADAISKGWRIAVVFNRGKELYHFENINGQRTKVSDGYEYDFPKTWHGYKVIDGDETDLRFLDAGGIVVGLSIKGNKQKKADKENKKLFFVSPDSDGSFKTAEKATIFGIGPGYEPFDAMTINLNSLSRNLLIEWLIWNDRNGVHSDKDRKREGVKPYTKKEAIELIKSQRIGEYNNEIENFIDWVDNNVIYDGEYYSSQDAQYRNKLTKEGLIEYYFKEFKNMKLKKGSAAAKKYMAALRARKSGVGKLESISKRGNTTYVKYSRLPVKKKSAAKKRVATRMEKTTLMALRNLQMQDTFTLGKSGKTIYERGYKVNNKDAYETFTLSGKKVIMKGSVKVNLIDANSISGYVHTKRRGTKTSVKYTRVSGVPSSMGAVGIAIGDVKKHSDMIAYYKDHIEKTKNYLKANSRSLDMRTKAAMKKDIAEHMKTIAHHKKMLSQAKKMIK
jgi:hypothetical protein